MRLRGIFDNRQPVTLGDRHDAVHLCRHSIQVHWDNCFRPRRDSGFEFFGVQRPADRINIDKNWRSSDIADGPCSRYESHRDRNNFISWTNVEAAQSQMQRARAAVQGHTMINSTVGCELLLEIRGRWPLS